MNKRQRKKYVKQQGYLHSPVRILGYGELATAPDIIELTSEITKHKLTGFISYTKDGLAVLEAMLNPRIGHEDDCWVNMWLCLGQLTDGHGWFLYAEGHLFEVDTKTYRITRESLTRYHHSLDTVENKGE